MKRTTSILHYFTVIVVLVFWQAVLAQENAIRIKGVVVDALTGKPLQNANIIIVGSQRGAAADQQGEFVILNVSPGEYTVKATMIGYEPTIQRIKVRAGEPVFVKFELKESFFQTDQIVVTATRSEKLLLDVPVVTEVVSKAEIEEKGADDLADALEDRPGIVIESNSSGGKILRMNGIDNKRILLLIDGNPIAGKIHDRVELNLIDADRIDHIEIVKGPGSALYGSEAMGGVVNIITKGVTDEFKVSANAKAGSYDLFNGNLSVSGKMAGLGYTMSIDHTQEGPDKSGAEIDVKDFKTSSVSGKVQRTWESGNIEVAGEYKESDQNSELFGYRGSRLTETSVKHWNSYINFDRSLTSGLAVKAKGYTSNNFRTYRSAIKNSPMPASIDTTTEAIIGLRSDVYLTVNSAFNLDVGYDFSNNSYEADRIGKDVLRTQHGIFVQAEVVPIKKLTLMLGGRYDKITDIQGHFSPRVSAMYQVSPELKFRSAWGGGFRAPSFVEMYSDFIMPIPGHPIQLKGNSELKPEQSTGYNVGVEYFWNYKVLIDATFFRNDFKDMISDYWQRYGSLLSYRNIEHATFTGVEWQSKFYLRNNLSTIFSYNYTKIEHSEGEQESLGISPHTFTVRVNYRLFKNRLNLSLRDQFFSSVNVSQYVQQASGNINAETTLRKAYNLLDATATFKLNRHFSVRAGVTNITDYTNDTFGPWYGRRFFLSLNTRI